MAHGCNGTGTRPPRVVESMRPGHSAAPLWLPDPVCAVCGGETMQEAGKPRKNSETVPRTLLYEFGPFRVDPQKRLLRIDAEGTKLVQERSGDCFRIFPRFSGFLHSLAATNRAHWIG